MPFNFTMPQYQPPQLGQYAPSVSPFAPNVSPFSLALQGPPPAQQLIPTLQPPTAANVSGVQFDKGVPSLGGPQPLPQQPEGGGLGGKAADPGTGHYGPLGQTMSSVLGGIKSATNLGGLMSGLLGATAAVGIFGGLGKVAGFTGLASTIASMLGAQPGFDLNLGMPTEVDFQGVRDIQGAYAEQAARDAAARDMADRMDARQNEFDTMQASGYSAGRTDANDPGADPGGIGHDAGDTGQAGY